MSMPRVRRPQNYFQKNEQDKKRVSFLQPQVTPNEDQSIDGETAGVEAKPDIHVPRDTSHGHSNQLATDHEFSQSRRPPSSLEDTLL